MEPRDIAERFWLPVAMTVVIVLYGTLGYTVFIDDASPLDGLYWTVLTLGGVGFRDTELAGPGGELFSISLIVGLLVAVVVTAAIGSDLVASGDLARARRRRKMRKKIEALRDHFILCGFGRVGRAVVTEYRRAGVGVIVIEIDDRSADELDELGLPYLIADPQNDGVLEEAGIHRARGIVCAVDSDAINAFIALSARTLNPELVVVARAAEPTSVSKLTRVGVDHVVSPYTLTGRRMAEDSLLPRGAAAPATDAALP
ncbi:MAG: NAD-binding protein [Thermoleophilia bacterium]|nr:NAD-binding protein [Thermoleophilia bacterium]